MKPRGPAPGDEVSLMSLLEAAPVAAIVLDRDGKVLLTNAHAAELFGWTEEELRGRPAREIVSTGGHDASEGLLDFHLGDPSQKPPGSVSEWVGHRRTGERFPVDITLTAVPSGKELLALATIRDATVRKRLETDAAQRLADLERSNHDLQHFAYVASHDLQEPLRQVKKFLELLEKRYSSTLPEDAQEWVAIARDGATRMQGLIDTILEFSRIDTRGKPSVPVDSEESLKVALYTLETRIEDAGAQVTHGAMPTIMGDEGQLRQVFQNLVGNAIKFARAGTTPKVHVSAEHKGGEWLFCVTDNGIGIDPADFGKLFRMFERLPTKEPYPGTGMGLAIVKRIIDRHGGRIWVESRPGKGSTFSFILPARPLPASA